MDTLVSLSRLKEGDATLKTLLPLVPIAKQSSSRYRLVLNIAEKVLFTSFENEKAIDLNDVRHLMKQLLGSPPTRTGVWFGGQTKCSTCSEDREKWAACLLIGCSFCKDDDLTECALNDIEEQYGSPGEFGHRMSGQDDRLLATMMALLLLKDQISRINCTLDHRTICLHAFAAVGFNYDVILDWLNSELISIRLFSRLLDDLIQNWRLWEEVTKSVQKNREDTVYMSFMSGTWLQNEDEASSQDLILNLRELAGKMDNQREVRICPMEPLREFVPYQIEASEEPYSSRLGDMFYFLGLKLAALSAKNLGNYTVLQQKIEEFVKKLSSSEKSFMNDS